MIIFSVQRIAPVLSSPKLWPLSLSAMCESSTWQTEITHVVEGCAEVPDGPACSRDVQRGRSLVLDLVVNVSCH